MKIVTILIISTIVTLPLFAQQQIIFEEAKPEAYLVKYESGNQHTIKNDIIRTIAKSIPKNLYRTEFSYSYIQRTRIVRNGYNLDLKAELTDVEMKGDIRYRGFNVGDVLLPGKISFRMNLTDLQNKRLIFHDFQDIPLEGTPIVLIDYAHTDSSNHTFRMDIVNKQFIYDAGCKQAFDARAQFVDSYYNSDIQLKSGFRQLQLIDLNNTDLLFDYRKVAENVDALINSLQAFDFHRNLDLDLYDPISFEQKFSDLYELNAEIKNKLDYMLTHLYEVYYDKGMWFLGSGNIEMARLNFNKSVNAGLMFAPAHYQLAMLDFDEGKLRQAETNILNITGKMNPDPKTLSLTIELAGKIFDIYLKETGKYLDSGKYDFAIEELKKAQNLCEKIRGLHCSNHYHDLWTRTANGKMNEYLDKANSAIAARAFEDAKELIKTAKLFKSNYSRYITGDQDMNATLTKLYNAYIGYGMEFYNKNDCAEAMINYRQAKNICSQNPGVTCTEELNTVTYDAHYCIYEQNLDEARRVLNTDPDKAEEIYNRAVAYQKMYEIKTSPEAGKLFASIKQAQYGLLISQGIERSEKNDYEGALVLFDKAKSWEGLYPVTPDTKLDKITRNTAVSLILSEAGLGEKEADKNRLEQARKHFSTARNLKNKYDLENDSKVSSAISDLKNKIFSRECKNAQAEYDRQFDLALEYIDKKEFINAENTLNEAIRFAEKNTECDISTISLEEKHTEILPGSVYQQLLSRTEELIGTKYYREAIEKYIEAGTYFSDRKVARLNLTHLPLQDYFIKTNSGFVLFGVRYYTNENQYSDALRLLGELRKRNFNPASTRENQELLGTKLAVKDHDENPGGDSKQTVLSHTQGDKWYKYLRKAYLKKWKKL